MPLISKPEILKSYNIFRKFLLCYIEFSPNSIFNLCNPKELKFLTSLRLGFSHLNEHKFNHNLQNCLNIFCTCSHIPKSTIHFFLHCHHYTDIRKVLFNKIKSIDEIIIVFPDEMLVKTILFGDPKYNSSRNLELLNAAVKYILDSNRFSISLF